MAGFLLYPKQQSLPLQDIRNIYRRKGWQRDPVQVETHEHRLLFYPEQRHPFQGCHTDEDGNRIFVSGFLLYRNQTRQDSLTSLLKDWLQDRVERHEIRGTYCILFVTPRSTTIWVDPLYNYHLFVDRNRGIISSSFLALLVSRRERWSINRMALLENLVYGYTIGPATLVDGIEVLSRATTDETVQGIRIETPLHHHLDDWPHFTTRAAAADYQLQELNRYFQALGPEIDRNGATLGLSGGYDSRLLLAITRRQSDNLSAFTYNVRNVHNKSADLSTSRSVAAQYNLPFREIVANNARLLSPEEIERNALDVLYYYDGRCNKTMGRFEETSTRAFRLQVVEDQAMVMNGLNGEIYRNMDRLRIAAAPFDRWLLLNIGLKGYAWAFEDHAAPLLGELVRYTRKKVFRILGMPEQRTVDRVLRRYIHSSIVNVYNYGMRYNAEFQIGPFLAPFGDHHLVRASYAAERWIGRSGDFEGQLIQGLDPSLAQLPSSYGYSLTREPVATRMQNLIMTSLPISLFERFAHRHTVPSVPVPDHVQAELSIPIVQKSLERIHEHFPTVQWDRMMIVGNQHRTFAFVGSFLNEFETHLKW